MKRNAAAAARKHPKIRQNLQVSEASLLQTGYTITCFINDYTASANTWKMAFSPHFFSLSCCLHWNPLARLRANEKHATWKIWVLASTVSKTQILIMVIIRQNGANARNHYFRLYSLPLSTFRSPLLSLNFHNFRLGQWVFSVFLAPFLRPKIQFSEISEAFGLANTDTARWKMLHGYRWVGERIPGRDYIEMRSTAFNNGN